MKFNNFDEKCLRYLEGTICVVRGLKPEPALGFIYFNGDLFIYTSRDKQIQIPIQGIKKFSFESPKLGYVKFRDSWVYLSRIPVRKWKTGLHRMNTNHPELFDDRWRLLSGLSKVFKGLYDRFDPNLPTIKAVSENYACGNNRLYYRGKELGPIIDRKVGVETESEALFHTQECPAPVEFDFKPIERVDYDKDI
jgi:hypothetical protein